MKRIAFAVAPLLVAALAMPALAQQGKNLTTEAANADTVNVTVNGGVTLDYVYRSPGMTVLVGGFGSSSGASADGESTIEGEVFVGFNIALNDSISAHVEVGTEGVDDGATLYYGSGGAGAEDFQIREAHANIDEFLTAGLDLQLGITTWSFDVRGKGSSFAFDPRNSSSIVKNWSTVAMTPASNFIAVDVLEATGGVATWSNDQMQLDVVLLPAVLEGGSNDQDEALYAVDLLYTLDADSGSRVGVILAVHAFDPPGGTIPGHDNSEETMMFTFGGGVTLNNLVQNLELYGEIYFQFGDAGQVAVGGSESNVDAAGVALQVGAEYNLGGPWIGANITWISGDDDAAASGDTDVDAFMSYENVNDLAILEDMWWGFDWDSNYFAIKISAGITLSVAGGQDNLELEGIVGFANTVEDVTGLGPAGTSSEDALGTEFDAKATWALNSQFNLHAGVAFLFGSDVLEGSMETITPDEEDTATLFYVGFGLAF